jgi:hypothetical protein
MKRGIDLIADERNRQIVKEGFDSHHDDSHITGELGVAAACYAALSSGHASYADLAKVPAAYLWPWEDQYWKPSSNHIKNLVRAGALIAAEIDRLQRLSCAPEDPENRYKQPLACLVANCFLDMSVGLDTLKFAAENHPDFWDGESGPDIPNIKITNLVVFAEEVARAINTPDEVGGTLLSRMMDDAVRNAIEDGCDGIDHD